MEQQPPAGPASNSSISCLKSDLLQLIYGLLGSTQDKLHFALVCKEWQGVRRLAAKSVTVDVSAFGDIEATNALPPLPTFFPTYTGATKATLTGSLPSSMGWTQGSRLRSIAASMLLAIQAIPRVTHLVLATDCPSPLINAIASALEQPDYAPLAQRLVHLYLKADRSPLPALPALSSLQQLQITHGDSSYTDLRTEAYVTAARNLHASLPASLTKLHLGVSIITTQPASFEGLHSAMQRLVNLTDLTLHMEVSYGQREADGDSSSGPPPLVFASRSLQHLSLQIKHSRSSGEDEVKRYIKSGMPILRDSIHANKASLRHLELDGVRPWQDTSSIGAFLEPLVQPLGALDRLRLCGLETSARGDYDAVFCQHMHRGLKHLELPDTSLGIWSVQPTNEQQSQLLSLLICDMRALAELQRALPVDNNLRELIIHDTFDRGELDNMVKVMVPAIKEVRGLQRLELKPNRTHKLVCRDMDALCDALSEINSFHSLTFVGDLKPTPFKRLQDRCSAMRVTLNHVGQRTYRR